jgi:tetratricopeptide (TPR) repeat protein
MKSESIAFGIAGILFGLIAGWMIGAQQAKLSPAISTAPPAAQSSAPAAGSSPAAVLNEQQVTAFKSVADREPKNPEPRVRLGNLYFDAERYAEAIPWYAEGVKLAPKDPDVSTDLGICYFYTNQPDKALEQFDASLKINPKHLKTLLNVGIVKAFGKQDLKGAQTIWEQIVQLAPDSPEAQQAKRALDSIKSAHPNLGSAAATGS